MAEKFLGTGWAFPVQPDEETGGICMSGQDQDIREALLVILGTRKGERVMRPDFGCGIHDFVFSVVNTSTLALIETSVREALTLWEPRIEVSDVNISTEKVDEGLLNIDIAYKVRTTNNRFNLVYPFYLTEAK